MEVAWPRAVMEAGRLTTGVAENVNKPMSPAKSTRTITIRVRTCADYHACGFGQIVFDAAQDTNVLVRSPRLAREKSLLISCTGGFPNSGLPSRPPAKSFPDFRRWGRNSPASLSGRRAASTRPATAVLAQGALAEVFMRKGFAHHHHFAET